MKIFGHFTEEVPQIDMYAQDVASVGKLYGIQVAHSNLLKYFFQYADYDEYHLFMPDLPSPETEIRGALQDDTRIKLYRNEDFGRLAKQNNYHVFYKTDLVMAPCLYMRNRFAGKVPATGVTHTISCQFLLERFTHLMLEGFQPWDSILCTSPTAKNVMRRLLSHIESVFQEQYGSNIRYKGRLDVIPLGVDTNIYQPREKPMARRVLELPENKLILLYFGRFSDCDKADLVPLLIAFKNALEALSHKSHPEPILLLSGEDTRFSYLAKIKKLAVQLGIANNLIIRPNPPIVLGPLYYSASDIFICPSDNIQETFGQVIIEAMSSGLPVICSDWDGFRHTVIHGENGLRIPTYWATCDTTLCDYAPMSSWQFDHLYLSQATTVDVGLMTDAICHLVVSSDNRCQMSKNARRHALENFSWKTVIAHYVELWNELHELSNSYTEQVRGKTRSLLRPNYCHAFQCYPTFELNDKVRVRTNSSASFPSSEKILQQSKVLSYKVSPILNKTILQLATNGISIGQLEEICSEKDSIQTEDVRWHVLRLLKYSYLVLDSPAQSVRHDWAPLRNSFEHNQ